MATSHYNFKSITVVPTAKDLKEIVLSKTQRKTPTVVHRHYQISRIRQFYTRKIKFLQQTLHDKLTQIINEFPKQEDVHPFYSDLMHILYDKDHYKVALGQINTARHLIDNVSREYTRLMKYGDSLYRCKMLKRAALGRMVKLLRRNKESFEYLEQVRQHLSRLPSIDPNTRTLIICGFPNVGKSSLINKLTRADVEVQPYAFTTKSLYVGHMDYKYLRWQVIDTPGILDHPLEERNNIEMQAVTALANLRAAVLYIMDLSEQCGHSIEQQVGLFEEIRPCFDGKPVLIGLNKMDVVGLDDLADDKRKVLSDAFDARRVPTFQMSTLNEHGLIPFRNEACDRLLESRVEAKLKGRSGDSILERVYVAMPKPRDDKERPAFIPEAVLRKREEAAKQKEMMELDEDDDLLGGGVASKRVGKPKRKLEREIEVEMGDEYTLDLKKNYLLSNPDEKYDKVPEIWEGHNIADFIDAHLPDKFADLKREEDLRERAGYYDSDMSSDDEETRELRQQAAKIRRKMLISMQDSRRRKAITTPTMPRQGRKRERSFGRLEDNLNELGVDISAKKMKHLRETSEGRNQLKKVRVGKSPSLSRSVSRPVTRDEQGVPDKKVREKARKVGRKAQRPAQRMARAGEGDRHISVKRPKHLFTGKRGIGKTNSR